MSAMARFEGLLGALVIASSIVIGCSSETIDPDPSTNEQDTTGTGDTYGARAPGTGGSPTGVDPTPGPPGGDPTKTPTSEPTAAALLAKLGACSKVSSSRYAKDSGGSATIDVCGAKNAIWFQADMDIDCDGKSSNVCNKGADASYQAATAAVDSKGGYLDAATLPYVVVPGTSSKWNYKTAGIKMGTVVAVIYDGKVEYGIVGDIGPTSIVGEASYAMAKSLGVNPNPSTGGVASGVTYIFFPGATGVVSKNEDHAEAVTVGRARAAQFLTEN